MTPTIGTSSNAWGTIYAVADTRARVTGWTPQSSIDGSTVYMNPLTTAATPTPTPITLTFSKAMNPLTVTAAGVSFSDDDDLYPASATATVTLSADGLTATIIPAIAFPKGDTIYLNVGGTGWTATDGTALAGTEIVFYTTPGMVLTGASWLDANLVSKYVAYPVTSLSLTFSEAPSTWDASATSLYNVTTGTTVPAAFSTNGTLKTLVATPSEALIPGDTYEVRFSVNSGVAGDPSVIYNSGAGQYPMGFYPSQLQFTVDPKFLLVPVSSNLWAYSNAVTTSAAITTSQFPVSGTGITVVFNRATQSTPAPLFNLYQGANTTGTAVPIAATTTDNITYNIATVSTLPLKGNTQYTFAYTAYGSSDGKLVATNISGNNAWTFTTAPNFGVNVTGTNFSGSTGSVNTVGLSTALTITFDKAIVSSPAPVFTLNPAPATPPSVSWNTAGTTVTLTPLVAFTAGTIYAVTMQVYGDAQGATSYDSIAGGRPSLSFKTTAALAAPSTNIVGGTISMAASATPAIVLVFNQPIQTSGTYAPTFALYDASGTYWFGNGSTPVASTFGVDSTNTTITITPTSALAYNHTYGIGFQVFPVGGTSASSYDNARISAGVVKPGYVGNAGVLTFSTSTPAALKLLGSNLLVNGVPALTFSYAASQTITLGFDNAVNQATTGNFVASYTLSPLGTPPVTLTPSYDATGTQVTLTPSGTLTPSTAYTLSYTVYPATGAVSGGNGATQTLSFTTAAMAAPTVGLDSTSDQVNNARTTYDNGDSTYYLQLTSIDPMAKYVTFDYGLGNLSTNSGYIALAGLKQIGSTYYYGLSGTALVSGQTFQVRARQSVINTGNTTDSPNCATQLISDGTKPNAVTQGAVPAVAAPVNNELRATFTFTLGGSGGPMTLPTAAQVSTTAGPSVTADANVSSISAPYYSVPGSKNTVAVDVIIKANTSILADYVVFTGVADLQGNLLTNPAGTKPTEGQFVWNLTANTVDLTQ